MIKGPKTKHCSLLALFFFVVFYYICCIVGEAQVRKMPLPFLHCSFVHMTIKPLNLWISQATYRGAGRWGGWRPLRAGWGAAASRAAGGIESAGCGRRWDSADRRSDADARGETSAGSWKHPESPGPEGPRSLRGEEDTMGRGVKNTV